MAKLKTFFNALGYRQAELDQETSFNLRAGLDVSYTKVKSLGIIIT